MGIKDFLLGATCARCDQQRTRSKVDDIPTCDECHERIVKLKAAAEEKRPCPIDGVPMVKEVVHMLVIDRCPTCHGVWLDAEELDAIKKASQAEGYGNGLAVGIAIG
jgi:hypothetical protein